MENQFTHQQQSTPIVNQTSAKVTFSNNQYQRIQQSQSLTKINHKLSFPSTNQHYVSLQPEKKTSQPIVSIEKNLQDIPLSLYSHHSQQYNRLKSTILRPKTQQISKSGGDNQNNIKKVLIIYSSGSIGAKFDMVIQKNYLKYMMLKNLYLCDYNRTITQAMNQQQEFLISPIQANGVTIAYNVMQFSKIQSSIYANVDHFKQIVQTIQANYQNYDSFIILCGLDVMCYIASAVSFMIENLQKLIIFTGGYMPLSQMRNDGVNNIVQSFAIISQCSNLGEVMIVSKNKGLRANRCSKIHEGVTDSIQSPNYDPLIQVNIIISLNQHLFLSRPKGDLSIFTDMSKAVKFLKYHPYTDAQSLQYEIANPNIKGIVIQSYGAANLPVKSQILQLFKQQHQKSNKIFINISQATHTTNHSLMANFLRNYCIIYGGDMTPQAAIAKLSYLIGKGYKCSQIEQIMKKSLRGEVTQYKNDQQFQLQHVGFVQLVCDSLQNFFPTQLQQAFQKNLISNVATSIDDQTDVNQIQRLFSGKLKNEQSQIDGLKFAIQNTNMLHKAVKQKNIEFIKFLIKHGADLNKQDQKQCSPCFYALKMEEKTIIRILLSHGGSVIAPMDILFQLFIQKLKLDSVQFFQLLYHMQFKETIGGIVNSEGRSVAHLSILLQAQKCAQFLKNRFKLLYTKKDTYAMSGLDYVARSRNKQILKIFR